MKTGIGRIHGYSIDMFSYFFSTLEIEKWMFKKNFQFSKLLFIEIFSVVMYGRKRFAIVNGGIFSIFSEKKFVAKGNVIYPPKEKL